MTFIFLGKLISMMIISFLGGRVIRRLNITQGWLASAIFGILIGYYAIWLFGSLKVFEFFLTIVTVFAGLYTGLSFNYKKPLEK